MTLQPYYADDHVTLYHGHFADVLPQIEAVDCIVTDPPYAETSLTWDQWPTGWPALLAQASRSMWCFGSMRMFLDRGPEFAAWKLSQDVVWEKHRRSGVATDRFARIHEHALHWYRGDWGSIYHDAPRVPRQGPAKAPAYRREIAPGTQGALGRSYWEDDGMRYQTTVIRAKTLHRQGINATQKPVEVVTPLVTYACPPGGTVLDPFAGSATTLIAARDSGRRAIGIEVREEQCESAANRLSQQILDFGALT